MALIIIHYLQKNCVSSEEVQFVHFRLGKMDDRIVIRDGFIDKEPVGLVLCLGNRRGQILGTEIYNDRGKCTLYTSRTSNQEDIRK